MRNAVETLTVAYVDALSVAELPVGKQSALYLQGKRILLCHTGSGIYALENKCPHAGMPLCGGAVEGDVIRCPTHNATFDVRSGAPTRARNLGAVRTFPVQVIEGRILVALDTES